MSEMGYSEKLSYIEGALQEAATALVAAQSELDAKDAIIAELKHLLQDVADGVLEADGRADDGIIDMQIVRDIRAFVSKASQD